MKNHDAKYQAIVSENPNMAIPWFLMACYAYDKLDSTIITDACFDALSETMANNWDSISHWHKPLIRMENPDLFKGSCVVVDWDKFPDRIKEATRALLRQLE